MKKPWLLSPLFIAASLFGSESFENEIARGYTLGQSQKRMKSTDSEGCTTCCEPIMNYRLPADFWGIDTFVEYLLWQVQEQASQFVVTSTPNTFDNSYPNTFAEGRIRSQQFDWSSGVRVGFGYSFGRDVWQLLGQYTWYNTTGQHAYTVQTPVLNGAGDPIASNYLMPVNLAITANGVAKASGSAFFSYQMADLMLSSAFLATEQIQFNYSFGATGGYIKEDTNNTFIAASTPFTPINSYSHINWRFGGGGLRAGFDTNWHTGSGLGFFGKVSFAAILGQYTNHVVATIDGNANGTEFGHIQRNSIYQGIMLLPTSQFILGIDWCRTFANCWVSAVKVSLAGEFNHLSDLEQTTRRGAILNLPNQDKPLARDIGSVYMYGATAHFGVDY